MTTKEGLEIDDEYEKKRLEELKSDFEPLTKLMKEVLGDMVEKVLVSSRMVDTPCVLTTSENGWSANMECIMKAKALRDSSMTSCMVSKKTMKVKSKHSLKTELKNSVWGKERQRLGEGKAAFGGKKRPWIRTLEKVLGAEFEARPIAEQTIALHVISVAVNFVSLNKVYEWLNVLATG